MKAVLIKNANIVNEGKIVSGDVLVQDGRIAKVADNISARVADTKVIDADGSYLLPGMIDDQVHFREPGLTHKATIESESKAAVAGGLLPLSKCQTPFHKLLLLSCWRINSTLPKIHLGPITPLCSAELTTIWRKS